MTIRVLEVNAHGADTHHGGTEKHVEMLGEGLPAHGFDVGLLSAFPSTTGVPFSRVGVLHKMHWQEDPIRRWRNHAGDVISRPTRALVEAVAAHDPDVVHTHNLPGISTGIWEACRRLGIPIVHSLHDYHLLCPRVTLTRPDGDPCRPHPLLCGLRQRRLARWAGAVSSVVAVSRHLVDRHAGVFPHAATHVIRNPFPRMDLGSLRRPSVPPETIGYIGNLASIKGLGALLDARAELNRLGYQVRIAGRGPLQADVEAAARSQGLRYDGLVDGDAKLQFLAGADVGIIPSTWEEPGAPTHALVEWLSAGRPTFVSNRGGLAEAAEFLPGTIPIEPSPAGIVEAAERLLDEGAAQDAVERAGSTHPVDDVGRWLAEHVAVLRGALR